MKAFLKKHQVETSIGLLFLAIMCLMFYISDKTSRNYPDPNTLVYSIDDRTGLCYAQAYRRLANVPCTEEVLKLINLAKEEEDNV